MKIILVTGAGGYIGSVLVPKLLKEGYFVRALDRYYFGKHKLPIHHNLKVIRDDVRHIQQKHLEGSEAVIDLAAISNDPCGDYLQEITYQINYCSRLKVAKMAKEIGVKRYILASTCSIYGSQKDGVVVNEESPIYPITHYSKANHLAEKNILPLADNNFCVSIMRLATVFGYSPRMRFDLVVNAMTLGLWKCGLISMMRNGEQWRPLVHVQDITDVISLLVKAPHKHINKQILNVGANKNNYQIKEIATELKKIPSKQPRIEWYGSEDKRSYKVDFSKINKLLKWEAKFSIYEGALEIYNALQEGKIADSEETLTLNWYKNLIKWHKIIKETEMYGGIFNTLD